IIAQEKSVLQVGDVICSVDTEAAGVSEKKEEPAKEEKREEKAEEKKEVKKEEEKAPVVEVTITKEPVPKESYAKNVPSPAADKMIKETGVSVSNGTGKAGRITKADVLDALKNGGEKKKPFSREEKRDKMSSLRRTVSKHLVA